MSTYFSGRYAKLFIRGVAGAYLLAVTARKELVHKPRSVVVVQISQLGDMVCTTPVFRALKKHFPEIKLTVVGTAVGEKLLENNSDIDQYVVFNEAAPEETAKVLRAEKIEAGIVIVSSLDSLLLLAFARIPFIIAPALEGGNNPADTKLYRFLRSFVVSRPHTFGAYAPREYLRLLEPLGIQEDDTTKHLGYSVEAFEKVKVLLEREGIQKHESFVCITPGAGNKIKEWPPERFANVAEHIWGKYHLPVVIIGSAVDQEEVTNMLESLAPSLQKGLRLVNTCTKLSIDELKALLAHARLLIGVDTGPIYIAEAFNTPLIDIVGPVGETEQPPTGKNRISVVPPGNRVPELHVMNARIYDAVEARRQVMSTTVEMVTAAVDTLLG